MRLWNLLIWREYEKVIEGIGKGHTVSSPPGNDDSGAVICHNYPCLRRRAGGNTLPIRRTGWTGSWEQTGPSLPVMSNFRAVPQKKKYKDDELLVKFKSEVSDEKKNIHKQHGAEKLKEFPRLRLHHVKLKKGISVEEGVKLYQADPAVEYCRAELSL